ncbi:asparagine synthase-related protein [Salinisphaera sp. T31B1]|uniref:asparagine synthase-related protein n=1 Tax=Salinisphaera sp. T31B1 TaxID=727963 RepID=UPI00334204E2
MDAQSPGLNALLHYGYCINPAGRRPALPFAVDTLEAAREQRRVFATLSEDAICRQGLATWKRVCRRILERRSGPFLLPLSAGLDSRAVLAGMVDQQAPSLHTVTYGIAGAFDYEIAPDIARRAGVANDRIDLAEVSVGAERIEAIADEPGRLSFVMDMYFNRVITDRYGPGYTYLSGYISDVLAGKYAGAETSQTWARARELFAERHRHSRTATLTHPQADPAQSLPGQPWVPPELLNYDDQLEYAVRQECEMRPIVMRGDFDSIAPMLDEEWVAFTMALTDEQRRGRRLYKKMFLTGFPDLFELPTAATAGLPLTASESALASRTRRLKRQRRWRAKFQRFLPWLSVPPGNRRWQYIDFKRSLTEREDLSRLFGDCMAGLDASRLVPWINAGELLEAQRRGVANHEKALNVLLNLEVVRRRRPDDLDDGSESAS